MRGTVTPIALLLLALPGLAQQHAGTLKLDDLIAEALSKNPEIIAARKKLEAARQRPAQASSLPDPMFSAGYASVGGPLPGQGLGSDPVANIGFMVSQQFYAPGKRKLRGAIALKEASEVEQDYYAAQLSVATRVKSAYHGLYHTHEKLGILERTRALLERMMKVTEARYAVAKAAQQDILKAQTQLTLLEAQVEKAQLELRSRQAELNVLLVRPIESPLGDIPTQEARESIVSLDELYAQAREFSPVLLRKQRGVERTELALNLAKKDGAIDYTISAGYANMGRMKETMGMETVTRWGNMYEARVDINLPFFTRKRQRAAVAEQAHTLDQARRDYQATGNQLLFKIKDDYLQSATSWRLVRMYSTTLIPQAALTLESSLPAYETGQVDFLTLLTNLMAVLEYEMSYHEELLNYHLALIRLEESTGLELLEEQQ